MSFLAKGAGEKRTSTLFFPSLQKKWGRYKAFEMLNVGVAESFYLSFLFNRRQPKNPVFHEPLFLAKKKDLEGSNIERMWTSWNIFCRWQFWERTWILLLSQQSLARLQVYSLKRTILSFQRLLCLLILAMRSCCLEWPLSVVALCRCKSPGVLWFQRKCSSLHHLKRSDIENLHEDPIECMWLSPLELNFPDQWF